MLSRLEEPVKAENSNVTKRHKEHVELVENTTKKIQEVNALHDEITKYRTTPDQHFIGFVLHSEKIVLSVEPYGFTHDWALIEL